MLYASFLKNDRQYNVINKSPTIMTTMTTKISKGFLVNILPRNSAIVITEKFFYDIFNIEKNEVVKQFILKKKKKIKNQENPN